MRNFITLLPTAAFLYAATFTTASAQTDSSFSLGVKLMPTKWIVENKSIGADFESTDGSQLAFNAALQLGRFFSGVNFQGGDYTFEQRASVVAGAPPMAVNGDITIKRGEFDLLAGYYFWSQVSIFLDIKAVSNDWQGLNYTLDYTGLGVGASGFIPLNPSWTLYGSLGFIPLGNIEVNNSNAGDGSSSALEFGAMFGINAHNRLNFGAKFQNQTYKFDSGEEQQHQLNALFIGYSYVFLY